MDANKLPVTFCIFNVIVGHFMRACAVTAVQGKEETVKKMWNKSKNSHHKVLLNIPSSTHNPSSQKSSTFLQTHHRKKNDTDREHIVQ